MRRCLLLLVALTSCAPTTRDGWLTTPIEKSEGLCWWRNARWEDRGALLVRGTGEPFARARARWAGELWRGSSTTAVLRRAGPLVVLQGEWIGPGLTLNADVDVGAHAIFRAYEPMRVGSAGLLLKGGHVRVKDAITGRALVLPAEDALDVFHPDEAVALELGCESLSLSAIPEPAGDPERRQLALSGFPPESPERWVQENLALPVSAQAGGPTVGRFVTQRAPVRGFVVDQRADEARLVVPTGNGLVWIGWVASEGLQPPGAPGVLAPRPTTARPTPPVPSSPNSWRSCEKQDLPVSIESRGSVVEVGRLQAGTAFSIVSRRGDYREVLLAVEWLDLEPNIRLLVPAGAGECPLQKQLGSW